MENKKIIQITFDVHDNRPHKAVRLYDVSGNALGFGEMIINTKDSEADLFKTEVSSVTYSASIDIGKLLEEEKKVESRKVKTVSKTEEPDVEDTADPEEDNWVRGSIKQLKDAKSEITLTTIADLREDYRKMKHNLAKSGDKTDADMLEQPELKESKEELVKKGFTFVGGTTEDINKMEICIACSGSGISSKMGQCFPCKGSGKVPADRPPDNVKVCPHCKGTGKVSEGFPFESKSCFSCEGAGKVLSDNPDLTPVNLETPETEPDEETRNIKNEILKESHELMQKDKEPDPLADIYNEQVKPEEKKKTQITLDDL